MAHSVVNLSYIGQPSSPAGGQIVADQTSGPKARSLYAYGTIVNGSSTFCTETSTTVNFIDGVQAFGKTFVLPINKVAIDATTNTYADYYTVGGALQARVGDSVTVAGCSTSANNGTFTVEAVSSSYIVLNNSSAVAETEVGATAVDNQTNIPVFVDVFYAGNSNDSSTTATASSSFWPSDVTATGFNLFHNSFTTTGVTVTFGAIIAFSS